MKLLVCGIAVGGACAGLGDKEVLARKKTGQAKKRSLKQTKTKQGKRASAQSIQSLGRAYQEFSKGNYASSLRLSKSLNESDFVNADYLLYMRSQSAFFSGDYAQAQADFRRLSKLRNSRFSDLARWRQADALWSAGKRREAAQSYKKIVGSPGGERAVAEYRIAADEAKRKPASAIAMYKKFLERYPGHALEEEVDSALHKLGDSGLLGLSAEGKIKRGIALIEAKKWEIALQELAAMDTSTLDVATKRKHLFWLSMSMFKRRRHYEKAGRNFLSIYNEMGARADEALFHGARALSRADFDKEAIKNYQRLVREYPRSKWAAEAQFLSGWLEFNMGNYREGIPYLSKMSRYGRSKFAKEAPWYLGMSYFLLGEFKKSIPFFTQVAKTGGKEVGGKGRYWRGRALQELGDAKAAAAEYHALIRDYPFAWYALLSHARLGQLGQKSGVFGKASPLGAAAKIAEPSLSLLKGDPLFTRADELLAAGLFDEASFELRRGEKSFLKRHGKARDKAFAALLARYTKASNFNRPWMLSVVYGGRSALNREPSGVSRRWWQYAYPQAYKEWVEKYRELSGFPDYYLYTIMRKESGFAPNTHSYADAQGLLQMIPPTTIRVVQALGMEYTEDFLFDPESNIKVGAWYIGRLLDKFSRQIPIGAGSYNSGPRAVMRWLDRNGDHPIDEFVELVAYRQTRNYMKRTTETYARYKYLYDGEVYRQPLEVLRDYQKNEIDY